MPLQNTGQILCAARQIGTCVGAFNIVDYLTLEAVIRAGESLQSPVIVQTSTATVKRYTAATLVTLAHSIADRCQAPVGLHLDHGTDLNIIRECIEAGYTSVMIDASHFPFEENIARTRQVVEAAHEHGLAVEGEIGVLAGIEDDLVIDQDRASYTTPEEAIEFQARTGVDFLAVAIGTAHGFYKTPPRLDIDTLRCIRQQVDFPLVVHGGSGLSFDVVRSLVRAGASKMNVSTQLKKTYIDALDEYIQLHREEYNPLHLLQHAYDRLVDMISGYIQLYICPDVPSPKVMPDRLQSV